MRKVKWFLRALIFRKKWFPSCFRSIISFSAYENHFPFHILFGWPRSVYQHKQYHQRLLSWRHRNNSQGHINKVFTTSVRYWQGWRIMIGLRSNKSRERWGVEEIQRMSLLCCFDCYGWKVCWVLIQSIEISVLNILLGILLDILICVELSKPLKRKVACSVLSDLLKL